MTVRRKISLILLKFIAFCGLVSTLLVVFFAKGFAAPATIANRQNWQFVNGTCSTALEGAVFGTVNTSCGGTGTSFDTKQIYSPVVIKDTARPEAPCAGIALNSTCYRLWYVGEDANAVPRIGHAVSPDGISWRRVVGSDTGGSVFGLGALDSFDSNGVSYFTILKDGATFKLWYSGFDQNIASNFTAGIGYATSSDGINWQRVPGGLVKGAVYTKSGIAGAFDQDDAYVPYVIKDLASAEAPCFGVAEGATCYRMWYEGVNATGGYKFLIGYATSGDGINWTRVTGDAGGGAILGRSLFGDFDENQLGIPIVIKDGAVYRMWYEAVNFAGVFTIGHVVSLDGLKWIRPTPNVAVYQSSNDPATLNPNYPWNHWVIKDGLQYRMWYTTSIKPNALRFGYAVITPGSSFNPAPIVTSSASSYSINFTTSSSIPAEGSILLQLPPETALNVISSITINGFAASAKASVEPTPLTDAVAGGVARKAIVIRLAADEPPGQKAIKLEFSQPLASDVNAFLQTFDGREVLEAASLTLTKTVLPPNISGVSVNNISSDKATIVWTTDKLATSQVDYGLTTSYGSSTPQSSSLVTNHRVELSGLAPDRTYHYRVRSADPAGNVAQSGDFTFVTSAVVITPTPSPVVTNTPTPSPVVTTTPTPSPVVTTTPTPSPVVATTPAINALLEFGRVSIGTSATVNLKISNNGLANLKINLSGNLSPPFAASLTSELTISPGNSQIVIVSCSPGKIGYYSANLVFTSNDSSASSFSYKLSCAAIPPKGAGLFKPLTPTRLYDSRVTASAVFGGDGAISLNEARLIKATGKAGIPLAATALVANVTVTEAEAGGYITLYPGDAQDSPTASVNWYSSGARTVGNFAIIGLDGQGRFKLKGGGKAEIVIDVVGYFEVGSTEGGIFKALPAGINPRLYDSRPLGGSSGLLGSGEGHLNNGAIRTLTVAGANSLQAIPAQASAVLLNLTVVNTKRGGYLTLYPAGTTAPNTTTINWNDRSNTLPATVPTTVGNFAVVPLSPDGKLSILSGGNAPDSGADIVIDVVGYISSAESADSNFYTALLSPTRLFDSRDTTGTYSKTSPVSGALAAGAVREISLNNIAGLPTSAKSVVVRITTVDVAGGGFLALYAGQQWPGNASVNTTMPGQVIGNLAVVQLANGKFSILNGGKTTCGFVIDLVGYFN